MPVQEITTDHGSFFVEVSVGDEFFLEALSDNEDADQSGLRLTTAKAGGKKEDAGKLLKQQLESIAGLVKEAVDAARPAKWELTLSIKFGGKAGVPFFAEANGESTVGLKLCWEKE